MLRVSYQHQDQTKCSPVTAKSHKRNTFEFLAFVENRKPVAITSGAKSKSFKLKRPPHRTSAICRKYSSFRYIKLKPSNQGTLLGQGRVTEIQLLFYVNTFEAQCL